VYLLVNSIRSDFLGICEMDELKEACDAVNFLYDTYISKDQTGSYVQMFSMTDPISERFFDMYPKLVEFLELFFEANSGLTQSSSTSSSGNSFKQLSSNLPSFEDVFIPPYTSTASPTLRSHKINSIPKMIKSHKKFERLSYVSPSSYFTSDKKILLKPASPFPFTTSKGFRVGWDGLALQLVLFIHFYLL
jgi:hypothetical protein